MYKIFKQYHNEDTTVGVENALHSELTLPVITVCNDVAYKRKVENLDLDEYLNATFSFEEMFPNAGI